MPAMRIRVPLILILSTAAGLWLAGPANAYSCVGFEPRTFLARSDAALVGTLLGPTGDSFQVEEGPTYDIWQFEIEQTIKGDLPSGVIEVGWLPIGTPPPGRAGFFPRLDADLPLLDACATVAAESLIRASQPLPPADAALQPRLLLGVISGDVSLIAISGDGTITAYGEGGTSQLAPCPDDATFVQMDGDGFLVREFGDLSVRRRVALPELRYQEVIHTTVIDRVAYVKDIACRGEDGSDVWLHVTYQDNPTVPFDGELLRVQDGTIDDPWDNRAIGVAFGPDAAYAVTTGFHIERIPLDGSPAEQVTDTHIVSSRPQLSPDGQHLLAPIENWSTTPPQFGLAVVDVNTGAVTQTENPFADAAWIGGNRIWFGAVDDDAEPAYQILDLGLNQIDLGLGELSPPVISGDKFYSTFRDHTAVPPVVGVSTGDVRTFERTDLVTFDFEPTIQSLHVVPAGAVEEEEEVVTPTTDSATTTVVPEDDSLTTQAAPVESDGRSGSRWPLVGAGVAGLLVLVSLLVWNRARRAER